VPSCGFHAATLRICEAIWEKAIAPEDGEPRITMFENRRYMTECKRLIATTCLASSLALLAWVLVGPMRSSGFGNVSSHPDCLPANVVSSSSQTAGLTATPVGKNARSVLAIYSEEEERDDEQESAGILPNVLLRIAPPRSFSRIAHTGVIASYLTQASSPLRC
jgi:hypothetical protein